MGGKKTYTIECDSCETELHTSNTFLAVAREFAAQRGWQHELVKTRYGIAPALDFCPKCVANGMAASFVEKVKQRLEQQRKLKS